ncbi:hypothetical protein LINPERHAP2_LOCUS6988 [Linum perenne]
MGAKKVILELDSLAAVQSINGPTICNSRHAAIIQNIHLLHSRNWQVIVRHCYREANRVANLLAHMGHCNPLGGSLPQPLASYCSECLSR